MLDRRAFVGTVGAGALAALSPVVFGQQEAFAGESQLQQECTGIQPYASADVAWQKDRAAEPKRVLVVVDYQNDFVDKGPFGRIETAARIEKALAQRVQDYFNRGDIVIYTMDTHPTDTYAETREGQVNPEHCVPGTFGWEIYGSLHELLTPERAIRVLKGTYGSPDLPFVVRNIQNQGTRIEYIEMAGVSTTCRVLHNAIMLYNFFPELPIVFDENTTASYTDERTAEQLRELESWGFIVRRS